MSTQERETTAPVTIDLPLWLIERINQISGKSGVDTSTVVRNALLQEIFPLGKSVAAAAIIALFGLVCAPAWSEELEVKGENTAIEAPKKVNYQTTPGMVTTVGDGEIWSYGSGGTVVLTTNPMQVKPQNPTTKTPPATVSATPAAASITAPATPAKPVKKLTRNCAKRG